MKPARSKRKRATANRPRMRAAYRAIVKADKMQGEQRSIALALSAGATARELHALTRMTPGRFKEIIESLRTRARLIAEQTYRDRCLAAGMPLELRPSDAAIGMVADGVALDRDGRIIGTTSEIRA